MKASTIDKIIRYGTYAAGAYFVGITIAGAIKRKRAEQGTNGIGAAERIKRRIYKEISLAQQAGIDFNKDYSEFSDEEIATLEELGHNASWEQREQKPYAQAYYESLAKAYNAISGVRGIGEAYDVTDASGNTILTWIEDAAAHVAHEREIEEKRNRTLELEAKAAEARKRKAATNRRITQQPNLISQGMNILSDGITMGKRRTAEQMSLFGIGLSTKDLLEPGLLEYLRRNIDEDEISSAMYYIDRRREPLYLVNSDLSEQIIELVEDWCINNAIDPESVWSVVSDDDILFAL